MTSSPQQLSSSTSSLWTELSSLKPTQCAVGMKHVMRKVGEMQELKQTAGKDKVVDFLRNHPAPVVVRNDNIYLIDNHHLCRALSELQGDFFSDLDFNSNGSQNIKSSTSGGEASPSPSSTPKCFVKVVDDLSALKSDQEFWSKMENEKWVHPYDKHGKGPVDFCKIPKHVGSLDDDLFRSVAALVKIQGGFKKSMIPYAEFQWANFFRDQIGDHHSSSKFEEAVEQSMKLAKDKKASHLPGYTGN
ncbi:hypothetical protein DFA_12032 [Cavenderia fasciculata]|uniref:ParB/Sulfiredoxin domain-containing protein n=1 Tax=Cavenderia fasciculata TaxID=261658 RepID=F4QFG1_CACFS|nr:uncharacterized protein DFA_12032 [Cavenderia fasciculata]EGG14262.1 hypothetical protein DFA_12032 [Cavenderia fasciculata]|eukprot:XP_004350971.1 hypothetical protein DFA_12032 [Cavenderia fasciculata]